MNWLLDLKKKSDLNVALVFVNGDMLEDWGLEKIGELPLKFKIEGKEIYVAEHNGFQGNGSVFILSPLGILVKTLTVGKGPSGFIFK